MEIRVSSPPPRPLSAFPLRWRALAPWLSPLPSGHTTFSSSPPSTPHAPPPPEEAAGGEAPFRAVRAARGGPGSQRRGLADAERMRRRCPRAFSLRAHRSSGAGGSLASVSVAHSCFPCEQEGARGSGVRVGSPPLRYSKSLLRTEWCVCKTAAFYSDNVGLEAAFCGPVGGAHSSYPTLLLLRGDEMRRSRRVCNKM